MKIRKCINRKIMQKEENKEKLNAITDDCKHCKHKRRIGEK